MTNDYQPVDEYSQAYRMSIDDVDAGQYIEVDEGIADDEYESLKIFIGRLLIMTMIRVRRITAMY